MHITATKDVCDALGGNHFPRLESPSLRLEKFVHIAEKRDKEHLKKEEIDAVVKVHNRHAESATPFQPGGSLSLVMKLGGRLIVNQAGGVLENAGLCLHRHFGYPTIPGSAVKGAARHAAWRRWQDAESVSEKRDIARTIALTFGFPTGDGMPGKEADRTREPHDYLDVFSALEFPELFHPKTGCLRALSGSVAFLPAVPRGRARLVTDIVNCHHKDYYAGKPDHANATDDEAPIPNFFPTVEEGSSFVFTVLPVGKRAETVERQYGFSPAQFALEMLREAVELHGVGAKTAAGYGWFEEDEEDVKARQLAELERESEARRLADEQAAEESRRQADLARREARLAREQAAQAEEAARLAAAETATLESLPPDADLRTVCGRVRQMLQARDALDETEKDSLAARLAPAFAALGKKDAKKLLNSGGGKGKDLWKELRRWLGDDRTAQLKKEVGAL